MLDVNDKVYTGFEFKNQFLAVAERALYSRDVTPDSRDCGRLHGDKSPKEPIDHKP
jgi:hypothetical protein